MDVALKSAGAPHDHLEGEIPHQRLTGRPFNSDGLRVWRRDYCVHLQAMQCRAGSKFHPHDKREILVNYDRDSSPWLVWSTQGEKLIKSACVTFENEVRTLDLVGEMRETHRGQNAESNRGGGGERRRT